MSFFKNGYILFEKIHGTPAKKEESGSIQLQSEMPNDYYEPSSYNYESSDDSDCPGGT